MLLAWYLVPFLVLNPFVSLSCGLSWPARPVGPAAGRPGALRLPQAPGAAPPCRASSWSEGESTVPEHLCAQGNRQGRTLRGRPARRVRESAAGQRDAGESRARRRQAASATRRSRKGRRTRPAAQARTWWDLADGGRVPAVALVTVGRLHKDGAVAEALREDLPSDVVEPHAAP